MALIGLMQTNSYSSVTAHYNKQLCQIDISIFTWASDTKDDLLGISTYVIKLEPTAFDSLFGTTALSADGNNLLKAIYTYLKQQPMFDHCTDG